MIRDHHISLRVTKEEKEEIYRRAEISGKNHIEFIRDTLLGKDLDEPEIRLTKVEKDLLHFAFNNTMLLRHLTERLGDKEFMKEAKEMSDKWRIKNYGRGE